MTTLHFGVVVLFWKKFEYAIIFLIGAVGYITIELLWRGYSHFTMGICGGVCFMWFYRFEKRNQHISLFIKCLAGSILITSVEFFAGIIINIFLKLNVWDYSDQPFNLMGQVCLRYSIYWLILSSPVFLAARATKKYIFTPRTVETETVIGYNTNIKG